MHRKGFTLIELLIVVVIIGILAAIAIPKFSNTKEKAALAAMKADLRNLATVEEAYLTDYHTYAASLGLIQVTPYLYKTSQNNTLAITGAGGATWAAAVTSSGSAKTCSFSYNTGSSDDAVPICN